jgi:hypothetical protein
MAYSPQQASYGMPQSMGNTSGQGPTAVVPAEVQGLNWGAFFWNWIWAIFNNAGVVWIIVGLFFSPIASIFLLIKGNELAWQNKQWASVEAFKATQRKWAIAGLALLAIGVVFACLGIVLSIVAAGASNS